MRTMFHFQRSYLSSLRPLCLLSVTYPCIAAGQPVVTPNFEYHPGKSGLNGNELVTASGLTIWNSSLLGLPLNQGGQGDFFEDTSKPYDVVIEATANLYAISNSAGQQPDMITLAPGSSLINYGILNTFWQTFPQYDASFYNTYTAPILTIGNDTTVINYGYMGFISYDESPSYEAILAPPNSSGIAIHNYGFMAGDAAVRLDGGNLIDVYNHAGGILEAGEGNSALGPNVSNFQDAGMLNLKVNGSYCEHAAPSTTQNNWGYCMGSSKAFYLSSGNNTVNDYGGPLVPATIDEDGHIIFNGALGSTYESVTPSYTYCAPNGLGQSLDAGAVQINGSSESAPATLNLYNTVYTIKGTKQTVNYLPSMYGYPIENFSPGSGYAFVNLYFSNLTVLQQNAITSAINAAGTNAPGAFTLDGSSFFWCALPHVNAYFTDTIRGHGIKGNPLPGVYFPGAGGPAYFTRGKTDPLYETNPYYLTNAATVQLNGSIEEQPGQTVVEAGWTLVIGSNITTLTYPTGSASYSFNPNPSDDAFNTSPSPSQSILLQAADAVTHGNVDGKLGQQRTLFGSLIINNPAETVALPSLLGPGELMQVGRGTTILAGTANNLTGQIYLRDGTLRVANGAGFLTPPTLAIGSADTIRFNLQNIGIAPVFDISPVGPNTRFAVGALKVTGQYNMISVEPGDGLSFPTINLGSNTLVIGDGQHTTSSAFVGGFVGSGGIEVANGTTLSLGGITSYAIRNNTPAPLSTYDGSTVVDDGATLILQNQGITGTGSLINSGTVKLGSGFHFQDTNSGGVTAPASSGLPTRTVGVIGGYTQSTGGTLVLRVHNDDGTGAAGSGAGLYYDQVIAGGPVVLSGTLQLDIDLTYKPAPHGSTITIITAPGGVTGGFSTIQLPAKSKVHSVMQAVNASSVTLTLKP